MGSNSDYPGQIDAICAPENEGGLPGWCSPAKGRWLADVIQRERLIHVVEIGVFGGRSLLAMALAVRQVGRGGFVLGVDSYDLGHQVEGVRLQPHIDWAQSIPFETLHANALSEIRSRGLQNHCAILRAGSLECAGLIGPATVDLLHIDGCHSVLASCRDVETWVPKVRPGGLVVLDDCEWESIQTARRILAGLCEPQPVRPESGWEVYRRR